MKQPVNTTDSLLCTDFNLVRHQETERIKQLRQDDSDNLIGLAFSGGGIRSATLNLGILQGFAKHAVLSRFDYLSTVSGGGYIGAWFSSLIKNSEGGLSEVEHKLASASLEPSKKHNVHRSIEWLRAYSNYLTPKVGLLTTDTLTAFAQWLTNTIINQLLIFSMLIVTMMATIHLSHSVFCSDPVSSLKISWDKVIDLSLENTRSTYGLFGLLFIASSLVCSMLLSMSKKVSNFTKFHPVWIFSVGVIGLILFFWNINYQEMISLYEFRTVPDSPFVPNPVVGFGVPIASFGISLFIILLIGLFGQFAGQARLEWWHRIGAINIKFVIFWVGLFSFSVYLPYQIDELVKENKTLQLYEYWTGAFAWLFSFASAKFGQSTVTSSSKSDSWIRVFAKFIPYIAVAVILLCMGFLSYKLYQSRVSIWCFVLIVIAGNFLFSINLFSLHHYYRNRLTRCYLGAIKNIHRKADRFTGFDENDDIYHASLAEQRPLHIINTALNISDGSNLAWQQRKASNFMFSPLYCGFKLKEEEVYYPTNQYSQKKGPKIGSLIATSGAAASPNMGYHTNPVMGLIMTLFNARLGRWFGNPLHINYLNRLMHLFGCKSQLNNPEKRKSPVWNAYYLVKELFTDTDSQSGYLYLSDGGHFENLGIYELVRRRCKLIVAVDGGEDGQYQFEDLGNAIRKCKVDFGITINISIDELLPMHDCKYGSFKCGSSHFAIGTIDYLGDGKAENLGYLVYLKSSLTGDEPTDLINFKLQELAFPHHSTIDQFFNESQFESYRRLGEHIADYTAAKLKNTGEIKGLLWPEKG